MPYKSVQDLPDKVRENLPHHAEEIYVAAYNSAWDQYDEPAELGDDTREERAHKVAWGAVKRKYHKDPHTGRWQAKE